MSQPAAAASASRAESSALWTPRRRCAGAVAAPVSCATPSAMRKLAPPAMTPARSRARHTVEAEPRDLVERRALLREGCEAAGNRDREPRRVCRATVRGLAGPADQLRLDALDSLRQGGVAEEGQSAAGGIAAAHVAQRPDLRARLDLAAG